MTTKKPRTSGELKSAVRDRKRERGLVPVFEVWLLPDQMPRLNALLAKFKREQDALELLS